MPPVAELTYKRASINLQDAGRLGEGEDLNDALLDFFMKLGQNLIPKKGDDDCPVSYLGSIFFQKLTSAFATSGEEGWKQVSGWAKRKAGGLFKAQYTAFAVPINEELKDEKGKDNGNHWWLAIVLNPTGGAMKQPMSVMCLDSMQRRDKKFEPALEAKSSLKRYTMKVTKIEQAGYLLIIGFEAKGDGTSGPLQRPEQSRLTVDGFVCTNPTLGLRINMPGASDTPGCFQGELTFAMDGRCRSSTFIFEYGMTGYAPLKLEFDQLELTKMQKNVSRFLGGYLAKEWEMNGPDKKVRFEKQSARALVADVHQQENLNDCGVFVLENMLRSLAMRPDFLKAMAGASPEVLKSFPWPTQADVTTRKTKLKAIVGRLFSAAALAGGGDVDKLLKDNDELRLEVLRSLVEERAGEIDKWSHDLDKELQARTQDKLRVEAEQAEKDASVQARRDEEKRRREEDKKRAEEERLAGLRPSEKKVKRAHVSLSRSRSRSPSRRKDKKDGGKKDREKVREQEREKEREKAKKRRPSPSRSRSRSVTPPPRDTESEESRERRKPGRKTGKRR